MNTGVGGAGSDPSPHPRRTPAVQFQDTRQSHRPRDGKRIDTGGWAQGESPGKESPRLPPRLCENARHMSEGFCGPGKAAQMGQSFVALAPDRPAESPSRYCVTKVHSSQTEKQPWSIRSLTGLDASPKLRVIPSSPFFPNVLFLFQDPIQDSTSHLVMSP